MIKYKAGLHLIDVLPQIFFLNIEDPPHTHTKLEMSFIRWNKKNEKPYLNIANEPGFDEFVQSVENLKLKKKKKPSSLFKVWLSLLYGTSTPNRLFNANT